MKAYLDNPHWAAQYRYTMGPPNGGYYKRWIQGSVGMMEPLPLYSNEYAYLYMKHGQNNLLSYRGNVKKFSPSVTPELQNQVTQCSYDTTNIVGCQNAAVRRVFTVDSNPPHAYHHGQHFHLDHTTPHPLNASYESGVIVGMPIIPPNSPYQD